MSDTVNLSRVFRAMNVRANIRARVGPTEVRTLGSPNSLSLNYVALDILIGYESRCECITAVKISVLTLKLFVSTVTVIMFLIQAMSSASPTAQPRKVCVGDFLVCISDFIEVFGALGMAYAQNMITLSRGEVVDAAHKLLRCN